MKAEDPKPARAGSSIAAVTSAETTVLQAPFRPIWPDRLTWEDIIKELDGKMQFPGVSNAWTMPIKARIDMLSTGVRIFELSARTGDGMAAWLDWLMERPA